MVKQTTSPPEGLPEITEPSRKKLALLILLLSLFLLLGIHFLFHSKKTETKTKFAVEESYTLPNNEGKSSKSSPLKGQSEIKQLSEQQLALLQAKQKELQQRLSAPMMLLEKIVCAEPLILSVAICLMNLGTSILVGQLFIQGAS